MKHPIRRLATALLTAVTLFHPLATRADELKWHDWSEDVFKQAKQENKFVLLDLGAVWCHWCHVMDETTYSNKDVIALLQKKYLVVRVDQDSRPDLSNRYEDYGWPATVVFAADGSEIAKRRGFIKPREMTSLLQAIIDDPTPGPSVIPEKKNTFDARAAVPPQRLAKWKSLWLDGYDSKLGGWSEIHKLLDWDNVEYAMESKDDSRAQTIAREMLKLQRKLLDPVWGGIYQYSAEGDWDHPHFEKVMQMQAENFRIYAQGYERYQDPEHLFAAREIHRYLRVFLTSPDGVVYTSQDADLVQGEHGGDFFALDDKGRRALGIPRIDKHIYARENGWVIVALVEMFAATGEDSFLHEAIKAAKWIIENRAAVGGGFRHDEHDAAGPYLGDTLAMGRAFLRLYAATGDRAWMAHAENAAKFIAETFKQPGDTPGLISARAAFTFASPKPQFDENIALARFANMLHRHSGNPAHRALAESAFRFAASDDVAGNRGPFIGALLQAVREMGSEPLHIVIVGRKDDKAAQEMMFAALQLPDVYKQVEWFDRREGPLPGVTQEYPDFPMAAAFICANGACSAPVKSADALRKKVHDIRASSPVTP